MRHPRWIPLALSAVILSACAEEPSKTDTASRMLNEMRASARPIPPKADPRDGRIAELERLVSDRDAELGRLRNTSGQVSTLESQLRQRDDELAALRRASAERDRLAGQVSDLERQLSARDQELGGLRGGVADKDRLAGELTALRGQLSTKDQELAALKSSAGDRDRLSAELAQAKQRIAELERQLAAKDQEASMLKGASDLESEVARRDQEMAGLRGALDQQKTSLAQAKDDLSKLLQAEVSKGHVTMKQLGDQLTLGLATTLLFDSGESMLKPGGMDVLKRIGGVLKQYPDRSIHVAGHTDNVPIKGALAKKYPTNQELSQARAESARQALIEGGMSPDRIDAMGHADTRPIASNASAEGRQKNRRVEIVVKQ